MKRKTTSGYGLMIGVPTLGRPVPLEWAWAFKSLNAPINYNTLFSQIKGLPVADARNLIAEEALKNECKYLFFLGDDVEVPPHTLKQLIYRMENNSNLGVVGGVYCSKSEPPAPLVFRENGKGSYWDFKVGEFFEVSGIGMDCTLIRCDVLNGISKPWFKTVDSDKFTDGENKADQWTEDLYFLKKVTEETDYKVFCDASILCKHWDVYDSKAYTLPPSLPLRKLSTNGSKKAIDIGCGPIDRSSEFPEHILVRVDIREECTPDYRCDVTNLPFANCEFDLAFSSHVLEHFSRAIWESVLEEWCRVIKIKGEIILCLPNIEWAAKNVMNGSVDKDTLNVLYGGQSNDYDFHYNGLTPKIISNALVTRGFSEPSLEQSGYNMILRSSKLWQ